MERGRKSAAAIQATAAGFSTRAPISMPAEWGASKGKCGSVRCPPCRRTGLRKHRFRFWRRTAITLRPHESLTKRSPRSAWANWAVYEICSICVKNRRAPLRLVRERYGSRSKVVQSARLGVCRRARHRGITAQRARRSERLTRGSSKAIVTRKRAPGAGTPAIVLRP